MSINSPHIDTEPSVPTLLPSLPTLGKTAEVLSPPLSPKQEKVQMEMQPTIGKLDIDVNKGAGVDPALAMLSGGNRGMGGLFGGDGMLGGLLLGTLLNGGLGGGNANGAKDAIYSSSLSGINATNAAQISALQSAATTNLAISNAMNESTEAIGDVKATVATSQALVAGAVAQVGLETCRQFGDLSTQLAVANGTTRTEAVASEARQTTTILQGFNNAAMTTMAGFNQVERGQDQLQRSIQETACDTQKQLAECCCEMKSGIKDLANSQLLSEMRITQAVQAEGRATRDLIVNEKINALETENSNLKQTAVLRDAMDRQLQLILTHTGTSSSNGNGRS